MLPTFEYPPTNRTSICVADSTVRCLSIDANEVVYPERGGDNSLRSQIQRLLAGCSDSELEMLLAVNRDILKHIRLRDEIRKTTTV